MFGPTGSSMSMKDIHEGIKPPAIHSWGHQFQSKISDYGCETPNTMRPMKEVGQCVAVAPFVTEVGIALVLFLKEVGKGECEDRLNLKNQTRVNVIAVEAQAPAPRLVTEYLCPFPNS